jgi:glutamate--cysteine ligase
MLLPDAARARGEAGGPLSDFLWGLERETHRILPSGSLSRTPHPEVLRPPAFTRDFAETQLEIVTPPRETIRQALAALDRLIAEAQRAVGSELLWPFSMPPRLPEEPEIQIAQLGAGEAARRARLYREGLALRYGKARQMVCGVHVNLSFGDSLLRRLASESPLTHEEIGTGRRPDAYYLRLTRNLYQDLPLLVLLFGASPLRGGGHAESEPMAISYRNSPKGYARDEFLPYLDLASADAYLAGIRRGLRTESPAFARLGLVRAGRALQLNANVFQTDKEFYAPIRMRQTLLPGESTTDALAGRGVGYLELRFLDVDPFGRPGVTEDALRLIHLVLLNGLAQPSVPRANAALRKDLQAAAHVALLDPRALAASDPLLRSAERRLAGLEPWARRLDADTDESPYRGSLDRFRRRVAHPGTLPSAALARELAESGTDWTSFGVRTARAMRPHRRGVQHALDHARL